MYLWENWPADGGCQPWRAFAAVGGEPVDPDMPYPIIYRPTWPPTPPECEYPNDPVCARPLQVGESVDETGQCGPITVLHDSVGLRILDPSHAVTVVYADMPPEVDFATLPPHLCGGEIGGGGEWSDRVRYEMDDFIFVGVMSDRDREFLYDLSLDATYRAKVDELYDMSREQLTTPLEEAAMKFVTVGDIDAQPGWITVAFQDDYDCEPLPVSVETWRVDCPPYQGSIRVLQPTCPFNEMQVLQFSGDLGGEPENFVFQWQWSDTQNGPWHDYAPPQGYENGVGLREVVIAGASPFTLADHWWRVRYRGYPNCPGNINPDPTTPWPAYLDPGGLTQITEWTNEQLAEGWVSRVTNGINPFDQRIADFHDNPASTYVDMISQAGIRYEAPIAMNCTPSNLEELGLIEIYETVLRRAKQFSIEQGISYDPANLAIMRAASKIADLNILLGHEAFADASDPTIGLFEDPGNPQPPSYDPHATFCFEGQEPTVLEEELALLRGRDDVQPPTIGQYGRIIGTVYNRLPWNFTSGNGQVAYANNYQVINSVEAMELYPQGHGDAWGHYLTATKKFYDLLQHPVFEWIVATEAVLVNGQPVNVGFQHERRFTRAAAAKARTGAALTSLTFRQKYSADPADQNGYPDNDPERAWGMNEWARRAGQGAYLDWVMSNALLDDDDDEPQHQNTIQKIDRTTVPEIREIAEAFSEIQTTMDNADSGLNPLGLASNVVPFGLDPNLIQQGQTHFDQIKDRAIVAMSSAVTAFDYANENTRRLRAVRDQAEGFTDLVEERELDFKSRMIELFGKPYPEDPEYASGYDGPDIYHFAYVDPAALLGQYNPSNVTTISVTFRERVIDPVTGIVSTEENEVDFNVSTDGLGMIKREGWSARPEPGEIQFARSETVQALGRYLQAVEGYESLLDQIDSQSDLLESLYQLNRNVLQVMIQGQATQQSLNEQILSARAMQLRYRRFGGDATTIANAFAEALPTMTVGGTSNGMDFTAPIRSIIRLQGAMEARMWNEQADNAALLELQLQQDQQWAAAAQQIQITGWQGGYQVEQAITNLLQLIRTLPARRLEIHVMEEAVNQATGRYHSTIGRALRLWEQRTAFRQRTADQVGEYRYRDMAFRVFRNDALQKYRAQFDLAARYVYLTAKTYDYETNLLGSNPEGGRSFLTDIVKERSLGVVNGGTPEIGNGLAGRLAQMIYNFDIVLGPQLGFNSPDEFDRTFSLRWELFRIPNTLDYDDDWRAVLRNYVVEDLNAMQEYLQYCEPRQPPILPDPAIVIPFSTTVENGLNLFGWPSTGDEILPADRFAIKIHNYGVRFANYPGSPLNNQVPVYLVPIGADVMRVPSDGTPREWHLLDQTLPVPFPIGEPELGTPGWIPWDSLSGGSAGMVRRRLIPTVSACPTSAPQCDISHKLTGRSVWNTRWLLVIPGSQLQGSDPANGIEVFINGNSGIGVRDIKLDFTCYGYSGGDDGDGDEKEK